jgi:hypothetical protein
MSLAPYSKRYNFFTGTSQGTSNTMNVNVTIKVEGGVINSSVSKTFPAVSIAQGQSLYDVLVALHGSGSDFTYVYITWSKSNVYIYCMV